MAIDTDKRRRSAVMVRRLPWFRRFLPTPDSTIAQADRRQMALVYSGVPDITPPGTVIYGRLEFTVPDQRPEFTVQHP